MRNPMSDSSGTNDDLQKQAFFQTSGGVIFSGAMRISSGLISHGSDLSDVEFQIHCIETEAYGAVLRAFIAQSDVLSWGKEGLITELRKELRVSDIEHREILGKINSDESIKSLREWRKSSDCQLPTLHESPSIDPSMGHVPRKKLKAGHATMSSSPKLPPCAQPSAAAIPSSLAAQARDDRWGGAGAALPTQVNAAQISVPVPPNEQAANTGKVRGSLIVQTSKKGSARSGFASLKPGSDIIEIRSTDKLIREVERVCGGDNPDPAHVEKAKFILREHEKALMDAIVKLADVSDDDSPDPKQHQCSNEQQQRNGHGFHSVVYRQFERTKGYYSEAYGKDHTGRSGIPFIDLQDDEYDKGR